MAASTSVELYSGFVPALNRHMAVLRVTPDQPAPPADRHHALILDCSISMMASFDSVKSNAQRFVRELPDSEYVSVTIFSGHGTARRICGVTRCDQAGRTVLEQAIGKVGIMNTTVFSEPLSLALDNLKQMDATNVVSQVILFTDGRAVPTMWDGRAEEARALEATRALGSIGAAVSVIGYGPHYDEAFINSVMTASGHTGIFRHMSQATDFAEVIRDIRDTFTRTSLTELSLSIVPDQGEVVAAYRANPEVLRVSSTNQIAQGSLFDGTATYYLELSDPASQVQLSGRVADSPIEQVVVAQPFEASTQTECVRVIAAHRALTGQTAVAIKLLLQAGDDGLVDVLANSHTVSERRRANDTLRRAFRGRTFIGAGLKPSGPSRCVINVLRVLVEDPSVVISLAADDYQRGGLQRRDPRVIDTPLGRTLEVVGYASHKERFNFSILTRKTVKVLPVDSDGNIIADGKPVDSMVLRTYNIVRDGELVLPSLQASMSPDSFRQLQRGGIIDASVHYRAGAFYLIDLASLKMVSSAWARPSQLRLADLLREEAELEAEQKALGVRIRSFDQPLRPEFEGNLYHEQAAVSSAMPREYYEAPYVALQLVKYKPADYSTKTADLSLDAASQRLSEVKRRLRAVRFLSRCITFACHLTGWGSVQWSEPTVTTRHRDPKEEQFTDLDQAHLRLLTSEVEVAFN